MIILQHNWRREDLAGGGLRLDSPGLVHSATPHGHPHRRHVVKRLEYRVRRRGGGQDPVVSADGGKYFRKIN